MMKYKSIKKRLSTALVFCLAFLVSSTLLNAAGALDIIRKQYIEYTIQRDLDAERVAKLLKTQSQDGTWPDIDYKGNARSGWKPRAHVKNAQYLARAYRTPNQKYNADPKVKNAVNKAVEYWLEKDYKCPNWWYNNISVPDGLINTALLMGDDMPANLVNKIIKVIMPRSKIGMTGQNKVWLASNVFVQSLVDGNEKRLKEAQKNILSELHVTTKEGIQPDWSFHQHGPQQQFGNYGRAFSGTMIKWGLILSGSSLALNKRQISTLSNYILEGPTWIIWKGRMDISGCGRQINRNCQEGKGSDLLRQLENMQKIDTEKADIYKKRYADNTEKKNNSLVGNKHFWRSDMTVHRRSQWYASVKMSSRRVIGAETCNSENMLGMHMGDGMLLVYQTAKEYENIQPFWDWHRLPGTTCDQSIKNLVPSGKKCKLPTDFVGGVTDGTTGIAVLDYRRDELSARKSCFFEKDSIVCLGAGITAEKSMPVLTSVQQSLLQSEVYLSGEKAEKGKHALKTGDWVHHAGIGYHILTAAKPVLKIATQKGDWKLIYPKTPENPQSGEVFSIWLDHGKQANNQSYAYVIFPDSTPKTMPERIKTEMTILSNTPELQAISSKDGKNIHAVFYQPGKLEWAKGKLLETDSPCLIMISIDGDSKRLYVADPTQKKKTIELTLEGKLVKVKLPQGGDAGKTVRYLIKP